MQLKKTFLLKEDISTFSSMGRKQWKGLQGGKQTSEKNRELRRIKLDLEEENKELLGDHLFLLKDIRPVTKCRKTLKRQMKDSHEKQVNNNEIK